MPMSLIARQVIAIVFGFASLHKLRDPRAFIDGVAQYHIVPSRFAAPVAAVIIVLEVGVACLHMTDRVALAVSFGVATLSLFAVGVVHSLRRGEPVSCFCFDTAGGDVISAWTL